MNIYVYTTQTCGFCIRLKEWLEEKQVEYIERDIINDPEARKEFQELRERGTPVVLFKNESGEVISKVLGFNKQKLVEILNIAD
jgi:glutaredoxin